MAKAKGGARKAVPAAGSWRAAAPRKQLTQEQRFERATRRVIEGFRAPESFREEFTQTILGTVGKIWQRPGLAAAERSLATIAILTALVRPDELRAHIELGLRNGLRKQQILEVILHSAVYGGFPCAVRAMRVAAEIFDAKAES